MDGRTVYWRRPRAVVIAVFIASSVALYPNGYSSKLNIIGPGNKLNLKYF